MNWYVVVVAIAAVAAFVVLTNSSTATKEKFSLPPMTFSQMPVNRTYGFASPIPDDASAFDKKLHAFTDARIPENVMSKSAPEPTPYVDSEIQNVAERALARAKNVVNLRYVSSEFAMKSTDHLGGSMYEIAFVAYDPLKNFAVKLALEALVAKNGKMYIKTFRSFNRPEPADAPVGTQYFAGQDAPFETDLGIDFVKMYG